MSTEEPESISTEESESAAADQGGGSTRIWIAVITTIGVILAAAIPSFLKDSKTEKTHKYSGFVHSMPGDLPVYPAFISISCGQDTPITASTDSNGTFVATVPKDAKSPILTVRAEGFNPEQRNINLDRTDPEPVYLKKVASSSSGTEDGHDIKTGNINNSGQVVIGNGNHIQGNPK